MRTQSRKIKLPRRDAFNLVGRSSGSVSRWTAAALSWAILTAPTASSATLRLPAGAGHMPMVQQMSANIRLAPDSQDRVMLKGGGFVRGTIIENRKGEYIEIETRTGQVKRIPWSDVAKVTIGADNDKSVAKKSGRKKSSDASSKIPSDGGSTDTSIDGVARLIVESTHPERTLAVNKVLAFHDGAFRGIEIKATEVMTLCEAPCDIIVDARRSGGLFFSAPGVPRGPEFNLMGEGEELRIKVRPGLKNGDKIGKKLMINGSSTGAAIALAGFTLFSMISNDRIRTGMLWVGIGGCALLAGSFGGGLALKIAGKTKIVEAPWLK